MRGSCAERRLFEVLLLVLASGIIFSAGCTALDPNPSAADTSEPLVVEEIMLGDYREYEPLSEAVTASSCTFIGAVLRAESIMLYSDVSSLDDPLRNLPSGLCPRYVKSSLGTRVLLQL